ncbi:MAG: RecX family transcriptional regulator, partial [Waddliaceae bacterium]
GPQKIARKLKERKIQEKDIHQALEKWERPQLQKERILALLASRYRTCDLNNPKDKQKVIASLFRRGFDLDQIHEAFNSTLQNF